MNEVVVSLDFSPSPKEVYYNMFRGVEIDPENSTRLVATQCYSPLSELGVPPKASYSLSATLGIALEDIDPGAASTWREYMAANGIASSFIPTRLTELNETDRKIVIGAGMQWYADITGKNPRFFWPSETVIDYLTLQILAERGIVGILCSPSQVMLYKEGDANNMPTRIMLDKCSIVAMPYDVGFSMDLASDRDPNHKRDNAYTFIDYAVWPALKHLENGCPLIGCVKGETFGRLMQFGGDFIASLLNQALPDRGITLVSINNIDFRYVTIAKGGIKESTNSTCEGSKPTFRSALAFLNMAVSAMLADQLGPFYEEPMIVNFARAYINPGPPNTTPGLSLMSSKAYSLTALSNCDTSLIDPSAAVKRKLLDARVSAEHLKDAGLKVKAREIWDDFLDLTKRIEFPSQLGITGFDYISALLGDRRDLCY